MPVGTIAPTRPGWRDAALHQLDEHGVGVDVASSSQREALRVAQECARCLGMTQRSLEGGPQGRVVGPELRDKPLASRRCRRCGDSRIVLGKKLLTLELHALPRRFLGLFWRVINEGVCAARIKH